MIDQIPKVSTIFSTLVNANGVRLDVNRYRDDFLSTTDEHNCHVTQWYSFSSISPSVNQLRYLLSVKNANDHVRTDHTCARWLIKYANYKIYSGRLYQASFNWTCELNYA